MMSRRLTSSSSITGNSGLSQISDNSHDDNNHPVSLRARPASQYNQHRHSSNSVPTLHSRVPTITSDGPRTFHRYTDDESEDQDTHHEMKHHDSQLTYATNDFV